MWASQRETQQVVLGSALALVKDRASRETAFRGTACLPRQEHHHHHHHHHHRHTRQTGTHYIQQQQ